MLTRWTMLAALMIQMVWVLPQATAQEPAKGKKLDASATIDKGLEWLKKTQLSDGRWEAMGAQYPTSMTALAGMCMLMEGSTLREGKYSDNLVKAVTWFMQRSQPNGLLGNPANPTESSRYMYGHGFGLLFLASVYG
ncbi:MAG: prenyltransferase/squalene oxidase repeat-containing protein, partial [Gemmataceae bacterium]